MPLGCVQLLPDLYDIYDIWTHKRPTGRGLGGSAGRAVALVLAGVAHYYNDMGSIPTIGNSAEWAALAFHFSGEPRTVLVFADVSQVFLYI